LWCIGGCLTKLPAFVDSSPSCREAKSREIMDFPPCIIVPVWFRIPDSGRNPSMHHYLRDFQRGVQNMKTVPRLLEPP
jgi:hypothetical protein